MPTMTVKRLTTIATFTLLPMFLANCSTSGPPLTWSIDYPGYETLSSPTEDCRPGQIIRIDANGTINYVTSLSEPKVVSKELELPQRTWKASIESSFLIQLLEGRTDAAPAETANASSPARVSAGAGHGYDMQVAFEDPLHEYLEDVGLSGEVKRALETIDHKDIYIDDKYYLVKDVISVAGLQYTLDESASQELGGSALFEKILKLEVKHEAAGKTTICGRFRGRRQILHAPFVPIRLADFIPEKVGAAREEHVGREKSVAARSKSYHDVVESVYNAAGSGLEGVIRKQLAELPEPIRIERRYARPPTSEIKATECQTDAILPSFSSARVIRSSSVCIWECSLIEGPEDYREARRQFDAIVEAVHSIDSRSHGGWWTWLIGSVFKAHQDSVYTNWGEWTEGPETGLMGSTLCRFRGHETSVNFAEDPSWLRAVEVAVIRNVQDKYDLRVRIMALRDSELGFLVD